MMKWNEWKWWNESGKTDVSSYRKICVCKWISEKNKLKKVTWLAKKSCFPVQHVSNENKLIDKWWQRQRDLEEVKKTQSKHRRRKEWIKVGENIKIKYNTFLWLFHTVFFACTCFICKRNHSVFHSVTSIYSWIMRYIAHETRSVIIIPHFWHFLTKNALWMQNTGIYLTRSFVQTATLTQKSLKIDN